jgi:subtilase family serine protease
MRLRLTLAAPALTVLFAALAHAAPRPLVTAPVDESRRIELRGNTRPEARPEYDRGLVPDSYPMENMQLLLQRPPELEAELESFMEEQQTPGSPNFHHWLTAEELGARFAPATSDLSRVTQWLSAHGFYVHGVQTSGMVVSFSGTAAQVHEAFQTEIHDLQVKGERHIANMQDPSIPEALAPLVVGVVSLHDFRPHRDMKPKPQYTVSGGLYLVTPSDLATIYNFKPLFAGGLTGLGQTIVTIEDTNVFSTGDWTVFRSTFGLSGYTAGSITQVHPTGANTCTNPGVVGGVETEAELDVEWASAAAPDATIELASCKDTTTAFGGLLALQNLVNGTSVPSIVSISYGECEAQNGATANAAYASTYQQAAAEGVSVFVSAGDQGAAVCDATDTPAASYATQGISVSGFASTAYNVAVGGTDFGDTYQDLMSGDAGKFWSATNSSTFGSAQSYVPEIPWNDSCASELISTVEGFATPYGSAGFCNSTTGKANFLDIAAGSGGPSSCASGTGATCAGHAKPSWQSLVGVPSDGVRDLPDVSLFAANGVWSHYYVYCDSDTGDKNQGNAPCDAGTPSAWSGAGGTSFAAPIWAGIQALVNQKWGAQGNPNTVFYALARSEYGDAGNSTCNSSLGSAVASTCIFNDVTQGDMDLPCQGPNCYLPSGTYGVLSTSTSAYKPAFGTGIGWDLATGIGTVNAANLVTNALWGGGSDAGSGVDAGSGGGSDGGSGSDAGHSGSDAGSGGGSDAGSGSGSDAGSGGGSDAGSGSGSDAGSGGGSDAGHSGTDAGSGGGSDGGSGSGSDAGLGGGSDGGSSSGSDAGSSSGSDAGLGGGSDAGSGSGSDAGHAGTDAGSSSSTSSGSDGGINNTVHGSGCGCGASSAPVAWMPALGLFLMVSSSRRRRLGDRKKS